MYNRIVKFAFSTLVTVFVGMLFISIVPAHGQEFSVAILVVDDFNSLSETYLLDLVNEFRELAGEYMLTLPEIPPDGVYEFWQTRVAAGEIQPFNEYIRNSDVFQRFSDIIGTDEYCALSLSEQRAEARGAGTDASQFEQHGHLVKRVLEDLQLKYPDQSAASNIDIIEVDTQGFSTSVIAAEIASHLSGYDAYIVNMSFAIVPCEAVIDIAAYDALVLESADVAGLNQAIMKLLGDVTESALSQATTNLGEICLEDEDEVCNPVQSTIIEYSGNTIFVAAAGNSGLDFPFYPAGWPGVVSVSASDEPIDDYRVVSAIPVTLADYSNWGDVLLPGVAVDPCIINNPCQGTSFAAPRLSFLLALYLAGEGGDVCQQVLPPLSVVLPALYSGHPWDNETILDAANATCPQVANYLP